jgi:hypothetical protein
MNKYLIYLFCGLCTAGMFVTCGDDTIVKEEEEEQKILDRSIRGVWRDTLYANVEYGLMKHLFFRIEIRGNAGENTSFSFEAVENPDRYIYAQSGSWDITGSAINLHGDSCFMRPRGSGDMVEAPDSTKNKTITIDTTGTGVSLWDEKLIGEYGDVWRSIAFDESYTSWFLLSNLRFRKDSLFVAE